ncbi:hypothetical protein J437_LFUL009151 [Ladona fulva]|uniref:Ig-like domain-containing protein n=1 Tax=Ladona fulva TaxID=123851 RepID=A0A8K0KJA7_LADFU|nr:hypothetical protein J437_LFUL009151 [Ladona fulva]
MSPLFCSIEIQVAWVRVDTQTILSIHHNVITQNPRISLSHNDHRSWYLHIRNAQEADRGWYMCQINTDPMRSRVGYIQVVVPPSIVDKETSSDMVVREGANVTLVCKAQGYPEPYVMWRREDGEDINYNGVNGNTITLVDTVPGSTLGGGPDGDRALRKLGTYVNNCGSDSVPKV